MITRKNPEDMESFRLLLKQIDDGMMRIAVQGLAGAARSFLISLLYKKRQRPVLVVCPEEKEAVAFARDLSLFLGEEHVFHYPALDFLTIDMFALQRDEELSRLEVLANLQIQHKIIVVASANALMQKVMPVAEFSKHLRIIAPGDTINRDEFAAQLVAQCYKRESLVQEKGEFSIRGNIIDIFPPTEKNPLRLEMLGDEIESIRTFNTSSQRSIGPLPAFVLSPAGEAVMDHSTLELAVRNIRRRADELSFSRDIRSRLVAAVQEGLTNAFNPIFLPLFYESYDTGSGLSDNTLSGLLEYLSRNTLVVLDDPLAVGHAMFNAGLAMDKLLFKAKSGGKFYLEKENTYFPPEAVTAGLDGFLQVALAGLEIESDCLYHVPVVFECDGS
jgi:transcription-repair coupling factor (superfamily II helicase)